MALVMFFGSFLYASENSFNDPDPSTCYDYADKNAKRAAFMQNWTHEQEHQAFEYLYDQCMDQ